MSCVQCDPVLGLDNGTTFVLSYASLSTGQHVGSDVGQGRHVPTPSWGREGSSGSDRPAPRGLARARSRRVRGTVIAYDARSKPPGSHACASVVRRRHTPGSDPPVPGAATAARVLAPRLDERQTLRARRHRFVTCSLAPPRCLRLAQASAGLTTRRDSFVANPIVREWVAGRANAIVSRSRAFRATRDSGRGPLDRGRRQTGTNRRVWPVGSDTYPGGRPELEVSRKPGPMSFSVHGCLCPENRPTRRAAMSNRLQT